VQGLGQNVFYILDLAGAGMARESFEDSSDDAFGTNRVVFIEGFLDVVKKIFSVPFLARLPLKIPTLVVKAANEHRQLSTQLDSFLDGKPVSERVKHRSERVVGLLRAILPIQLFHDFVQPNVGFLNRTFEDVRAAFVTQRSSHQSIAAIRTSLHNSLLQTLTVQVHVQFQCPYTARLMPRRVARTSGLFFKAEKNLDVSSQN
jgi:hypothetical protein